MTVTKRDMKKEATLRMKMLGLDEQIICDFQKRTSEIYISETAKSVPSTKSQRAAILFSRTSKNLKKKMAGSSIM